MPLRCETGAEGVSRRHSVPDRVVSVACHASGGCIVTWHRRTHHAALPQPLLREPCGRGGGEPLPSAQAQHSRGRCWARAAVWRAAARTRSCRARRRAAACRGGCTARQAGTALGGLRLRLCTFAPATRGQPRRSLHRLGRATLWRLRGWQARGLQADPAPPATARRRRPSRRSGDRRRLAWVSWARRQRTAGRSQTSARWRTWWNAAGSRRRRQR